METILRALAIYAFLLLVFRFSGKRSLAQTTTFDLVLLLVVGEATQQAVVGDDYSITTAMLAIVTLVGLDVGLSVVKERFRPLERFVDDMPLIIVEHGRPLRERMDKERVDEEDVLAAARNLHGLERMQQIKYAVLERNGAISIVPRSGG
ncbi:MAG: YetF domain-containing protein [Pseudomonadota bacterium]